MKQKIIAFSVVGLLLIGCLYMVFAKDEKKLNGEIQLLTEVPEEYTYADMMAAKPQLYEFAGDTMEMFDTLGSRFTADRGKPLPQITAIEDPAPAPDVAPQALADIHRRMEKGFTTTPKKAATPAEDPEDAYIRNLLVANRPAPAGPAAVAIPAPQALPPAAAVAADPPPDPARPAGGPPVTIRAVMLSDVEVADGGTVSILLQEGGKVNGVVLSKNLVLPGAVSLQGARLQIRVDGATIGGQPVELDLVVYDQDGKAGLRIQGENKIGPAAGAARDEVQREIETNIGNAGVLGGVVRVLKTFSGGRQEQAVRIPGGHKIYLKSTGQ